MDPEGRFFIVADGMGGHAGGQEASQLATEVIRDHLIVHWLDKAPTKVILKQALLAANQAILDDQVIHPERSDMGTTVVVLALREGDDHPWCAHVGDSRLYRLRGHQLTQITEDHTWIARAVREGEVTVAQARTHPWRHVLSQCLGREDITQLDIQAVDVHSGDRLLLCSDGLTEELPDPLIASHLQSIPACHGVAAALIDSAKQRGGRDNITVVVLSLKGALEKA